MQINITAEGVTKNVTQLIPSARWSGEYRQVARTLEFSVTSSPTDQNVPVIQCPVGAPVQMIVGEEVLFDGILISRTKSTEASTINLMCYDQGFYLKRNKAVYKFEGVFPEAIAAKVCGDFGIELGYAAPTGVTVSRIFSGGNDTLYNIIATVYTLAVQSTGKAYHIGFRGHKLYITAKEPDQRTLVLMGGSNLIAANTSETMENMVSAVQIYSQDGNLIHTVEEAERIRQYGRLQEVLKQTATDDRTAAARKLLADGDIVQKITVDCLGNVANVTGGTVVVREPYTGLFGLFYIDADVHEWKRGQYYNKLTLNFKAIMDEKEAGSLPNATGANTADGQIWDYFNKTGG